MGAKIRDQALACGEILPDRTTGSALFADRRSVEVVPGKCNHCEPMPHLNDGL
jgi:hypothetical protein